MFVKIITVIICHAKLDIVVSIFHLTVIYVGNMSVIIMPIVVNAPKFYVNVVGNATVITHNFTIARKHVFLYVQKN